VAELEAAVPESVEFVRQRLGLGDRPDPPFRIRFRDAEKLKARAFMSTFQEIQGSEIRPMFVAVAEPLVASQFDLRKALRHEITHCWQLSALGERFYALPRWVQEGLADWASGMGRNRMEELYVQWCSDTGPCPVERLVDGLDGTHAGIDYGEDWLAFAMVDEEFGLPAVQSLVRELFRHANYPGAFQRATGLPFPEFERRARAWAERYVAKDLEERSRYIPAKEAFKSGKWAEAAALYGPYLADDRNRIFRAPALLEQAACRLESGDVAGATGALRASDRTAPVGPLRGRSEILWIRIAEAQGGDAEVERRALAFLEDLGADNAQNTLEARTLLVAARSRSEARAAAPGTPSPR
jgi:hypothetical protein